LLHNTDLHHHIIKKTIKKRPIVVLRIGSTTLSQGRESTAAYLVDFMLFSATFG